MAADEKESTKPLKEFFYTWRIENVHLMRQNWRIKAATGEKLESPAFKVDWVPKPSFNLVLYPDGTEDNEDCIGIFIARADESVLTASNCFEAEFYLLALDGSKIAPESMTTGCMSMKNLGMLGHPRFVRWETLMREKTYYFPDDILTVGCRLWSEVKRAKKGNKLTEIKASSDKAFGRTHIRKEVISTQMVIDSIAPKRPKIGEIKSISQDCSIATFFASGNKISDEKNLIIDVETKKDDRIKMAICELMLIDHKRRRIFWKNKFSWNDISGFERFELSPVFLPSSEYYVPDEMFVEKFLFLACQFTFTTGLVEKKKEKGDYGTNLNHLLPVHFPSPAPSYKKPVPCPTLKDSLKNMYQDQQFHDVIIQNGSVYVTAHKFVLFSKPSKFDGLLKSEEPDALQVIHVEDDIDTMKKVVYFFYTEDILDINWQTAMTLYSAAKKYEIDLLKHKCCNFIEANLDKSKVVEILLLAKEHNDAELIALARNFITENRFEVYNSNEWNNFIKSHSQFAVSIMLPKVQLK